MKINLDAIESYGAATPAEKLALFMSELSEECYCASWLHGCELFLWDCVTGVAHRGPVHPPFTPRPDVTGFPWGMGIVSDAEADELRRLSELAGGWCRWDETADDFGALVFVPIDEWRAIYAAEWRP